MSETEIKEPEVEEDECSDEEERESISFEECPPEIIMYVCLFLELDEILESMVCVSKNFNLILDRDQFFIQLCRREDIDLEKKPSDMSFRKWYFKNLNPKILFLYTTNAPYLETINDRYLHHFPTGDYEKNVKTYDIYHLNKGGKTLHVPDLEEMKTYDVIVNYGGNDIQQKDSHCNDLVKIMETCPKISIVSMAYNNGGGRNCWNYGGRWLSENWNPIRTFDNKTIPHTEQTRKPCSIEILPPYQDHFSDYSVAKFVNEYGSNTIMRGNLDEKANLIANYNSSSASCTNEVTRVKVLPIRNREEEEQTEKKKENRFLAHLIAERQDCKLIHLNFNVAKASIDLMYECIKYIHRRSSKVEKYETFDQCTGVYNIFDDLYKK